MMRRAYIALLATDIRKLRQTLVERGLAPGGISNNAAGDAEFSLHAPEGTLLKFVQPMPGSLRDRTHGQVSGPATDLDTPAAHRLTIESHRGIQPGDGYAQLGFKEFWRGGPTEKELRWIMLRIPGRARRLR